MKEISLQKKRKSKKNFGSFSGVFVPTCLSILGVILFLRMGYIVGMGGLIPAVAIILLAASISFASGLSLSSITTNIRIGSGGIYSIVTKTLGLEVGGSLGIPLYLAQMFSVTLYLFGLSEAWKYVFPAHSRLLILGISFFLIFLLTFISTKIAINAQLIVFGLIVIAIISIFIGAGVQNQVIEPTLLNSTPKTSFWLLFALFFPAVTGIAAGVGLSGKLRDPKKNIPKGLLSAIGLTTIIYLVIAVILSLTHSISELVNNPLILVNNSLFGPLIIIGIIFATFSSALITFVAAPLLLHSMAKKSIFPGSKYLVESTKRGVPRKAVIVTAIPIIITLIFGSLNFIAPIITMFFLLTYTIVNLVVFIEQSIGLVSFRPTLKIPKIIPMYGAIASIVVMFLINAFAGIIAILFVFLSYLYLVRRRLKSKEGDIRSGLFISISEWAAKKVLKLPESIKHTWKPNILFPVMNTSVLLGNFPVIKSIAFPSSTMTVLGLDIKKITSSPDKSKLTRKEIKSQLKELPELVNKLGDEGIFTATSTVTANNYVEAVDISLEAIEGQTFPPNILFLPFKPKRLSLYSLKKIFKTAKKHKVGIVLSDRDEDVSLGTEEDINVWIPRDALKKSVFAERNFDLALLLSYKLFRNWAGTITVWMSVPKKDKRKAQRYIKKLLYEARFPHSTKIKISTKSFLKTLHEAPKGDIHLIPITKPSEAEKVRKISEKEKKSFFFVADSGREDVLA